MKNTKSKDSKRSSKNSKCNNEEKNNNDSNDGLGLASLSYADNIILASTLAYTLSEELSDSDLALLITFMYLVLADLQVIVAQNQIKQQNSTDSAEDDIGVDEEIIKTSKVVNTRCNKKKRYKGKKRHK